MNEIILLDGGMGQELIRRSSNPPHPMWSAKVLDEEPDIVEAVHREYILAGSSIITLNSYSLTLERLSRDGDPTQFKKLQKKSIEIALKAREDTAKDVDHSVKIAGCLPPIIASYRPDLTPHINDCVKSYDSIVEAQSNSVDLFICETMSSIKEAKAAVIAAKKTNIPIWVSFTIQDNNEAKLRSGESLTDAIKSIEKLGINAVLINCSIPESIDTAFDSLKSNFTLIGAYANGFTSIEALKPGGTVDSLEARKDLSPEAYAKFALNWVNRGAKIIGGCCEVGIQHIDYLHTKLKESGFVITN